MYTVKLAVYGIKEEYDPRAVHDIENELGMRSHIHKKAAFWEKKFSRAVIQVAVEGIDSRNIAKQMAEELFEVACAVLQNVEGLRVEIIDVQAL